MGKPIIAGRRTSFRPRPGAGRRVRARTTLAGVRATMAGARATLACARVSVAIVLALAAAPAAAWVAVDVGHTQEVPGARSAHGRPEFEFNLALARDLVE